MRAQLPKRKPNLGRKKQRPRPPNQGARTNVVEVKVCGRNACQALFKSRPNDIVRVYVTNATMREFGPLLKLCAEKRLAYHVVTDADLEKIAETVHHEGVCVLSIQAPAQRWSSFLPTLDGQGRGPSCLLLLDGVQNPHNVGAVLRLAAHFGVRAILIPTKGFSPLPPAALRTAEGGAEHVPLILYDDLNVVAKDLQKRKFEFIASDSEASQNFFQSEYSERVVFMMGSETHGLSKGVRSLATKALSIPGSGKVQSLNVSVATAVMCADWWRRFC